MTLRTGTVVKRSLGDPGDFIVRNPGDLRCSFDEREQALLRQVIVNETAFSPGSHPSGFPQRHQVLRDRRLAQPKGSNEVADASRLFANDEQDLDARRLIKLAENRSNLFLA